jgi:cobalt-zinc-cadmium efflux system membrane fusion protein
MTLTLTTKRHHRSPRPVGRLGLLSVLLLTACSNPALEVADLEAVAETPPVVETRWTALTELFVEYPPLVEGMTSRFAIHFTDLSTFEPVRAGRAVVRLTGEADTEYAVDAPGRPGIFGVDVIPDLAGRYRLELVLDAPGISDQHDLGEVTVLTAGEVDTLEMTGEEEDGSIAFLKEQQWVLDFATTPAQQREMADSLVIAAEIEPRTGGHVEVSTPVAGRLASDLPVRPIGSVVNRGDTLAEITPHSGHGEDRPALQLDVAEARDSLELARAQRARVERLVASGALPARRELEVQLAQHTAEARLTAAEAHLAQLDATRTGEGQGAQDIRFVLRAPMSGVVSQSDATAGASVEEGARLFEIVALDRVHVVGSLPEASLARIDELVGAELEVPGVAPVTLDRLVAVGRVLDRKTRTVPIIYELRDPDRRLAIGQAVSLRIFVAVATDAVTIPDTAIVDDAGQPVVFVQVGGESFERRAVQLGNREAGLVQITGDIAPGERIVTRGAPLIRLAALSPQVPAHGHTH